MQTKENTLKHFGELRVNEIMIKNPLYISPNEKISKTELLMLRKNIGGLPVIESEINKKLLGIITQRDIRLARFAMSLDSPNTLVKDLMTSNPQSVNKDESLFGVLSKMSNNNIERMPVVDENQNLIGLVLEGSILEKLLENLKKNYK